jgi:hypothetical protein
VLRREAAEPHVDRQAAQLHRARRRGARIRDRDVRALLDEIPGAGRAGLAETDDEHVLAAVAGHA